MGYEFIKHQSISSLSVVQINRPPANALNTGLVAELHSLIDQLAHDRRVRAVVFCGQGSFFAGGVDIKMMQERKGEDLPGFIEGFTVHLQRLYNKIEEMPKPVIAAINGHAAGGGCELALACDFRFMAKGKARIGLSEVKLGLLPGAGGLQRMPRIIGKAKALELTITGRLINAEEALEIGLVHKIFDEEKLLDGTIKYATELSKQATLAIGHIKNCIHKGFDTGLMAGLGNDIDAQDKLFYSHDGMEGIEAFVQKRPPVFEGR
ncbi:MAG: enoyl-CoA hydratase-related protein [Thermodesulfobacteriota bacterium]